MDINTVIQTGNPYHTPITNISSQLREIEWRFPFVTQALVFVVSCIVLVILIVLYITIGLISQISSIFSYLIQQARQDMRGKPAIEKTGFIVAIGIYFLIWVPLWLIQLPFFVVGWIWELLGYFTLVLVLLFVGLIWFYISPSAEIPFMSDLSRQIHAFLESAK
jgi:hypothetical protein